MRVDNLVPDTAPHGSLAPGADRLGRVLAPGVPALPDAAAPNGGAAVAGAHHGNAFAALVDAAGALLGRADAAEASFAAHRGGLQEMVVERARADIALQVAATAAQRGAQSLQTLLGMQI